MKKMAFACTLAAAAIAALAAEPQQIPGKGLEMRQRTFAPEMRPNRHHDGDAAGAAFISEAAMALAATYRGEPTEENKAALLAQLRSDYDAAIVRAKKRVENMERNRESRIDAAVQRLTSARSAKKDSAGRQERPEKFERKMRRTRPEGEFLPPPDGSVSAPVDNAPEADLD